MIIKYDMAYAVCQELNLSEQLKIILNFYFNFKLTFIYNYFIENKEHISKKNIKLYKITTNKTNDCQN